MFGLDYLGGAKYKDVILKEHPAGWAAGFFSNTFGNALPVVTALLKTGRCPRVRLHLVWRDDHKFSLRDIAPAVSEAKRVARLAQLFPSVEFRVSPWCEWEGSVVDFVRCYEAIRPILPARVGIVNTPLREKNIVSSLITEFHGAHKFPSRRARRIDFSFDGTSCVDADVESFKANYKSAETFYFWSHQANGRMKNDDKTPRPQRKAWPTSALIDSWIYLKNAKGQTKIPKHWIVKSHADQHYPKPEPRAGYPLIIAPDIGPNLLFKTANGQVVASAKKGPLFKESYAVKRYIYRVLDNYGFLLSEKAIRINGSPLLNVWSSSKKLAVVNLAFRDGSYR